MTDTSASGHAGAAIANDQLAAAMATLPNRLSSTELGKISAVFETASANGNAAASERCALFESMGVVRPQNWEAALDYLQRAAEQGSRSAQGQLQLLASPDSDPQRGQAPSLRDWADLRAGIRLDERITSPSSVTLMDSPRIRVIPSFLSVTERQWLLSLVDGKLTPATVFDKATGGQTTHRVRDNSFAILQLDTMDVVTELIRTRISAATRLPVPLFEPSQVLRYTVGQSFKPHHDYLDPNNPGYREELARNGQRIATFLIYLNDSYDGGETAFPAIGLRHRARAGDALFLANVSRDGAPDPRTLHAGMPPTAGEKWVFSQWIRDRPTSG